MARKPQKSTDRTATDEGPSRLQRDATREPGDREAQGGNRARQPVSGVDWRGLGFEKPSEAGPSDE